ncbi:sensor histidine kinase [Alkaliphilus peptidifermentans]|uniref:histidine kinase n=1 Tax=Alkaliphilus peptidifermentans DSM 18978 TaxID=1120976 RepID=A0A1G5JFW1_9FIRM|nr:HAMP domain-containing sensor histidine kinase [Alkaliphilus peptidifermentans]SCY87044.1 Signal transduction histidine kinase [Alkaliphilus peptidifermentans DSM 18978]
MTFTIRKKLVLMYILLILIPLILINYISVSNMENSVFHEVEVNILKSANIISNLSRDNFNDLVALKRIVKQYVPPFGGRLLIIDHNKNVMVDSFNLLEGRNINNEEIRSALQNKEKYNYYSLDERLIQVGVPINITLEGEKITVGVVLISAAIEEQFKQVEDFRKQLLWLSIVAASIGMIAAIIASNHIAKPIITLSHAAKRIGKGNLGETVDISTKDEIGRLVENFNYMSKELYRIDRGRTQFIGDVSHELKTPLASMKALIDSLLYGEDSLTIYKEYLRDMDTEIDRLTDLIKALLTLSKLDEQGLSLEFTNIKPLIEEVLKILKPLIDQANINIDINMIDKYKVLCDKERIREIFINLVDNAIKYRDINKESNNIRIIGKDNKDSYQISIEDNGIGMVAKDLEAIFEKFYRTDLSRSRDTGGAGIGLSIVDRIIKLHQWQIDVNSRENCGTTFIITIPKSSLELSL